MLFEKVSKEQYLEDCQGDTYYTRTGIVSMREISGSGNVEFSDNFNTFKDMSLEQVYDDIKIPVRATKKSAGFDFFAPYDFQLSPGETIKIATGIRVILDDDKFLMCVPRSGHGFKARIQLDNTIGIIDADYSDSSNEGHIHFKLTNDSRTGKHIRVNRGEGMVQAIIVKYYTVDDDDASRQRDGGFGSTTL